MDYSNFTRAQLLDRIESLEMLSLELLQEKEQEVRLEHAWTGSLGQWYWNVKTDELIFDPLRMTTLGYDKSEIPERATSSILAEKLHPEDLKKTMDAMREHLAGRTDVYEAEYRIEAKDGSFKWYYDRGRVTRFDKDGKPAFFAGVTFDITKMRETQLELEHKSRILTGMASLDELTKIGNHRTLIGRMKAEAAEAERTGSPLSIAIFDIDDFKKVNDSKGIAVGDRVLAEVASILKSSIRGTDFAGRYGSEEFVVIFPHTALAAAGSISERIRQTIEAHTFAEGLRITVSGGVSQYGGESIGDFVGTADNKLFWAKRNGKNRIESVI